MFDKGALRPLTNQNTYFWFKKVTDIWDINYQNHKYKSQDVYTLQGGLLGEGACGRVHSCVTKSSFTLPAKNGHSSINVKA